MSLIKGIAFDWGGVLIKNPVDDFVKECANTIDVSEKDFRNNYSNFRDEFERGFTSESVLWKKMEKILNREIAYKNSIWFDCFKKVYYPQKNIFDLVKKLKKIGYKIALLSNTEVPAMEYFQELKYNYFEVTVFSCAEGVVKPESQIYNILLDRLKLSANQILFIDDKEENIMGARKTGIKSIHYNNYKQLISELKTADIQI